MRGTVDCRSMLEIVRMFQLRRSSATLTDFISFLCVCGYEGTSVKQLAYLGGTTPATMSRSIKYLAEPSKCDLTAEYLRLLDLCSHPDDGRRRAVFLSEDGQRLRRDIESLLSPLTADGATA